MRANVFTRQQARYVPQAPLQSFRVSSNIGYELHEQYMTCYFDHAIEGAIRNQEDESYDNLDQMGPSIDVEKLLRKAKIDCLNMLSLGQNASRVEYARSFKVLSLKNAINN